MAEHEYVRLAAACHCGKPVRLNLGRGRKPKTCEDHARPEKLQLEQKECPACRGFFTPAKQAQSYCSTDCGRRTRLGSKPRQMWPHECKHCGDLFESLSEVATYCANRCKLAAWRVGNPERVRALRAKATPKKASPKLLCAYFTGHCGQCNSAIGGKAKRSVCDKCQRVNSKRAAREASRAAGVAKHHALGRVTRCGECALDFCPLYGASHCMLCDVCSVARKQEQRRVVKDRRKARLRGASTGERVSRIKVFTRDGWLCKLCGTATPRELMGTLAHNAPELDHIVPVSKGGEHTSANTQCLCRSCNGLKSDRTMAEVMAMLEA